MSRSYYDEKVSLVESLVALNKKKIKDADIAKAADKIGIPFNSAKSAWMTFLETGGERVDYRQANKPGNTKSFCATPTHTCKARKNKCIKDSGAAEVILAYIYDANSTSREICTAYNVSLVQFYSWLKELNVSGTLLGTKVLDPKKYAKLDVKLAIWAMKHPNTTRKNFDQMTTLERAAYARLGQVLIKYLQGIKDHE